MRIQKIKPQFEDQRGTIRELVLPDRACKVTFIGCNHSSIRGGHYHKKYSEEFIVVSGFLRADISRQHEARFNATLGPGDFIKIHPFEKHTFTALTDAVLMKFNYPGEDLQKDTFK